MSEPDVVAKLRDITTLDPKVHLFCEDEEQSKSVIDCLQILGFDGPDALPWHDKLCQKINSQLSRCEKCIIGYYKGKRRFVEDLRNDYDDEDVENFVRLLDETDVERIQKGLDNMKETLAALPVEGRRQNAVLPSDIFAMFEALTCESFLTSEALMSRHFDNPFALIQTKKALRVQYWIPALVRFLFDEHEDRRDWAILNWSKIPKKLTRHDFDFAIRDPLAEQLNAAIINFPTPERTALLWSSLRIVVDKLDGDLITHSLRAMEQDVYKLALDHLPIDFPGYRSLLQTLRALLSRGPADFWDAMGAIAPTAVVEQIFASPQYDQLLMRSNDAENKDILQDLLSWIEPFIASLQTSHKPQACRSLTHQLMSRLQASAVPALARDECYCVGLEVISQTLVDCCEEGFHFDGVGRVVALDTLNITLEHVSEALSILTGTPKNSNQPRLSQASLKIIKYALKLECNLVRTDRLKIHQDNSLLPAFEPYKPKIWPKVERGLARGNVSLARILIEEISELTGLEALESKNEAKLPHEKERKLFSTMLRDFSETLTRILEKINEFDSRDLDVLAREHVTLSHLFRVLFSAEQDIYETALDLMKTITGAPFRKDAISCVMQLSIDETLETVQWAMSRIAKAKTFAACSRMLRLTKDTVDILCDSQDGILRSQSLAPESLEIVQALWKRLWQTLRVVYNSTQGWAFHFKNSIMTDLCRDVMQASEHFFDQFSVFDTALKPIRDDEFKDDKAFSGDSFQGTTGLLVAPSETLEAVFGYLKLRDEYLLSTCVELIRKLLLKLTSRRMTLPQKLSLKLESLILPSMRITTNMTDQQKANIREALEDNQGHPIGEGLEDRSGTSTPDVEIQRVVPVKPPTKQGSIDLERWSAKISNREDPGSKSRDGNKAIGQASQKDASKPVSLGQKPSSKAKLLTGMVKPIPRPTVNQRDASRAVQQAKQADKDAFLKKREQMQREKKLRDAEAVAKAKKHLLPNSIAGITAGEGSALGNIGNLGKEHVKKSSEIMISSESESESEDEFDDIIFGPVSKPKPSVAVSDYNAGRRQQVKIQQPVKKIKQVRTQKDLRARVAPDLSEIHLAILAWDFFHDGDLPPGGSRSDYSMVAQTFRTAQDYKKTFKPLLLLEAWQSFRQAQEEASGKSFGVTIVNRMNIDSLVEISSTMDTAPTSERSLFEGDIILLSKSAAPSQTPDQPSCLARIFKMTRKQNSLEVTFRVAPTNPLLDRLIPKAELKGEKITSLIPLEREYGALQGLTYFDLCDEIIKAYPSPLLTYNDGMLNRLIKSYDLNRAQARAVQSAIDNDAFTLIQGPPGSGKTKTIVAIVGALLTGAFVDSTAVSIAIPQQPNSTSTPQRTAVPKKLLVCAPSNAAVDELVMRFMHGVKTSSGEHRMPSIVRLGKSDNINPKVVAVTLDELVEKKINLAVSAEKPKEGDEIHKVMSDHKATCEQLNELRAVLDDQNSKSKKASQEQFHQLEVLKRRRQQLSSRIDQLKDSGNTFARNAELRRNHVRQEVLDGAHILCATLSGSGHDMFRNLQLDFETVIIDEAAQSIELSALIPLKYGCSKCIMVGDPKQLPPTVLSREASRFQYEQSLFVRMQANSPNNVHLLDTQYRMHPEISAFPSRAFYESRLVDGPGMANLRQKPWHEDPLLSPYRFFDVQGMHQSAPKGHSLVNIAEIDIALKLFRRLSTCARGYDFQGKVGIITPYKSQLSMLRDRFKQEYGDTITKTIEFNTTDAFQGRESEVIIFSCVRASNTGIGFLSDIRRMNVGITRAKSSLWVLGNANSLMQGEYWSQLIQDSRSRKRYTGDVLKAIAQPPRRVHISSEPEQELGNQTHPYTQDIDQDIEMVDAPPVETQQGLEYPALNGINDWRAMKEERPATKKRSPPSPTEPSFVTKFPKSDGFDMDIKMSRQNSPSSKQSPIINISDTEEEDRSENKAQHSPKMRTASSTELPLIRAPGSAPKHPSNAGNRGVRPPAPIKKKADDTAFIKPKRRPK